MSAPVLVRRVASARDLRTFIDVPFRLFPADRYPNWVPPLRMSVADALDERKNPFYRDAARELFLAYAGDRVVGRIAAIENRAHNRFHEDRTGFFGFFECVDDAAVARALLDAAAAWLAARDLHAMWGPMNPSTNQECGLLVRGFENRPTFMTTWNPPYYDALCAAAGLTKAKDLLGFWFSVEGETYAPPAFVARQAERALKGGRMTFRDISLRDFATDVAICWEIYNDAWERNWGFVPMTHDEFQHAAKDLKMLLRPEWSFIAYVDGIPAGFMLAAPDYNEALRFNRNGRLFPLGLARMLWYKRRAKSARVFALGTKAAFRSRSILALFAHEIMRRGRALGGTGAEASWLLEDNTLIVKPMLAMGATERMAWRIYQRSLR
ncbi:MAG: N-acetyltransferase [Gemmatimonadetes bacterium]|nr:N-acetyltransferase [Gemmatimonadota bacterium]MBI3568154.1 N-acetyltransferase [Gemmatimonadota bacterium]